MSEQTIISRRTQESILFVRLQPLIAALPRLQGEEISFYFCEIAFSSIIRLTWNGGKNGLEVPVDYRETYIFPTLQEVLDSTMRQMRNLILVNEHYAALAQAKWN